MRGRDLHSTFGVIFSFVNWPCEENSVFFDLPEVIQLKPLCKSVIADILTASPFHHSSKRPSVAALAIL